MVSNEATLIIMIPFASLIAAAISLTQKKLTYRLAM